MKIGIILGTRPEIIKLAPLIKKFVGNNQNYFLLHTGQHYSYNLDEIFFKQLNLPNVDYNLGIGSGDHGYQTGNMLIGIEKVLKKEQPDMIIIQGDTNSVLAGAIVSSKMRISIGHVEAGLRSYDRSMPEEINRIIADHCSDYLFAPTKQSKKILINEGIPFQKIHLTGNTIVDVLQENLHSINENLILEELKLESDQYFLSTVHRQENVDNLQNFYSIITGLKRIYQSYNIPIIFPIHPRSRKMLEKYKLDTTGINLISPLDYLSFLKLQYNSKLILTDSGGVQEEACILNVPCVTLRNNTERPETIEVGANILAGTDPESIFNCVVNMLSKRKKWEQPFGDGKAAERIYDIIKLNSPTK